MLNFLKKLLGLENKSEVNHGSLTPQHNVNPLPEYQKPKAPKNPPKPRKKKEEVKAETVNAAPKKRGRPAKTKS